ncbi:MAG: NUDIX domain-containing protein [Leptolyngbyaceae cyanobacterium bins.59]|nr:NUDIX domain-containing protein [Leptolyngbyaceae cyanobacterium bins.59]
MKDASYGIIPIRHEANTPLFLLIQHHAGHWGFPKGHAESGENAVEAACREFEEETGILSYQLLGENAFSEHYWFTRHSHTVEKTVTYYLALVESSQVFCQAAEIKDYAWVPFEEAITRITFDGSKQILRQVHEYLKTYLPTPSS